MHRYRFKAESHACTYTPHGLSMALSVGTGLCPSVGHREQSCSEYRSADTCVFPALCSGGRSRSRISHLGGDSRYKCEVLTRHFPDAASSTTRGAQRLRFFTNTCYFLLLTVAILRGAECYELSFLNVETGTWFI